jgi:predicted DNA-binding protein (UPF0251 family)
MSDAQFQTLLVAITDLREEVQTLRLRLGDATLSQKETERRLGVSTSTVHRYREAGKLTAIGPRTRPRYDAREVERLARTR